MYDEAFSGPTFRSGVCFGLVALHVSWIDPWSRVLYSACSYRSQVNPKAYQFDRPKELGPVLLFAEQEADALGQDGFYAWPVGVVATPVVCGSHTFPLQEPVVFSRTGDVLRMDRHSYEIQILRRCKVPGFRGDGWYRFPLSLHSRSPRNHRRPRAANRSHLRLGARKSCFRKNPRSLYPLYTPHPPTEARS